MSYPRVSLEYSEGDQDLSNKTWMPLRSQKGAGQKYFGYIVAFGCFIAGLLGYAFVRGHTSSDAVDTCGLSASDAVRRGCSFDPVSFAWLPKRCFDEELTAQFLAQRDWQWYRDSNGTVPVQYEALRNGEYSELYVTQEYHMYHCTYMWRKMHRAIIHGQPLDGYIGHLSHTSHCEKMLLNHGAALNLTNTIIATKFVNCPKSQRSLGDKGWYLMVDGRQDFSGFPHHNHN
ncbi:hypothetical protein PV08_05687 [Exophiala spinifera]|uniref:Uncharacterized protein n=1 Tax=Exophiala spinifera TaxID=91928 RepID=A0A0D2B9K4_9EURO|nr:uncharacterized protein PV08_05687 [Exophiala spinifera]KIW15638.1 hypothetical protein PV08_05687 [Exophiala spinifera]